MGTPIMDPEIVGFPFIKEPHEVTPNFVNSHIMVNIEACWVQSLGDRQAA